MEKEKQSPVVLTAPHSDAASSTEHPLRHLHCFEISASGNGCLPGNMGSLYLASSPGLSVYSFTFALVRTVSTKNAGK